ncbi:MAG TPA: Gmad2 immunoglobulin-like domain-containing protein [Candidatus Paceibacterota bacterium]|nr:Gmad2 immunoglobulin-like domain-containing protein [Candidatus Paceibacterota bacterium]
MKTFITIIAVIVAVAAGWLIWSKYQPHLASTPSPSSTAALTRSPSPSSQPNITITSPTENQSVDPVITVTGKARVFENQFTVQARDANGAIVASVHAMTDAADSGQFGNYSVRLPIPASAMMNLKIEALAESAKGDGTYEGYAAVDVRLKTISTRTVYVAYVTSDDCSTTTLFPRDVYQTSSPGFMSVVELLKGPTSAEKKKGAQDVIPDNVTVKSVTLKGQTVYADFDENLEAGVAGSCRVGAIRSEITNTLKQFPGFNSVVVSINGRTADILQP